MLWWWWWWSYTMSPGCFVKTLSAMKQMWCHSKDSRLHCSSAYASSPPNTNNDRSAVSNVVLKLQKRSQWNREDRERCRPWVVLHRTRWGWWQWCCQSRVQGPYSSPWTCPLWDCHRPLASIAINAQQVVSLPPLNRLFWICLLITLSIELLESLE